MNILINIDKMPEQYLPLEQRFGRIATLCAAVVMVGSSMYAEEQKTVKPAQTRPSKVFEIAEIEFDRKTYRGIIS